MDSTLGRSGGSFPRAARLFLLAAALLTSPAGAPVGLHAQGASCDQLRAALAQPVNVDPGAAASAHKARVELDKAAAYAHSIGCDNQQFLFFGSAPPPQCGGLKARVAALRSQYDAYAARASGDSPERRALRAHYNQQCNNAPREKNFFEQLFGGFSDQRQPDDGGAALPQDQIVGNGAHGGSQAVCVRTCDGGFFPLNFSARSAPQADLQNLCQALCPNAEVKLYSRNPNSDINTALGADGTAYADLPNALKYTKTFDASCTCKPPNQSWVEALAHAEQVLDEMGGARASDQIVSEQQAKALSQPLPPKPGKDGGAQATPTSADAQLPSRAPPPSGKSLETQAPDGANRQIRVVGPQL